MRFTTASLLPHLLDPSIGFTIASLFPHLLEPNMEDLLLRHFYLIFWTLVSTYVVTLYEIVN